MGAYDLMNLIEDVLYQIIFAAEQIDKERQRKLGHGHDRERPSTLLSLCMTCKRLRTIGAPLIYRRATVCGFGECRDKVRGPYSILESIEHCEPFQYYGRVLSIELWDHARPQLALRLKQTLNKLPKLEKLRIMACGSAVQEEFLQVFQDNIFRLPNLHTLVVTNELQQLALKFSKISTLEIARSVSGLSSGPDEILRDGRLSGIRHLELTPFRPWSLWIPDFLTDLLVQCPQLTTLGTISCGTPSRPFTELLPYLARWPTLTVLSVDALEKLGSLYQLLAFNVGTPPGNNRQRELEERHEALMDLCRATFEHCCQLQVLWMRDEGKATCERLSDGSVQEIIWKDHEKAETRESLETGGFDMH